MRNEHFLCVGNVDTIQNSILAHTLSPITTVASAEIGGAPKCQVEMVIPSSGTVLVCVVLAASELMKAGTCADTKNTEAQKKKRERNVML